jgi:hypothetical protein
LVWDHDFAALMKEETMKRRAELVDSPPDPFLNTILETDERVERLKEDLPDIEYWVMDKCGIIINYSGPYMDKIPFVNYIYANRHADLSPNNYQASP